MSRSIADQKTEAHLENLGAQTPQMMPLAEATARIVSAWVTNNHVPAGALPDLIHAVSMSLGKAVSVVERGPTPSPTPPAVPLHQSVSDEWIVCLEDGLRFKSLKKHLWCKYDLTPEQYRTKWGLPASYPMVAPAYSRQRSALILRSRWDKRNQKNTPRLANTNGANGAVGATDPDP